MTKKEKLKIINPMAIPGMINMDGKLPLRVVWDAVCEYFEISPEKLRSKAQKREIIIPRHVFYFLARRHTTDTLSRIGEYGCDGTWLATHSNVYTSGKKVGQVMAFDGQYAKAVAFIEQILNDKKYG